MPLFSPTGYATFGIELSFDNGNSWNTIKEIKTNDDEWLQDWFRIEDYGNEKSDSFQVRFYVINSIGMYGLPNSLSEALVDDFEIITGNDEILTSVNENSQFANAYNIYPNPIKSIASISLSLETNSSVSIALFNIFGEKVNSIFNSYIEAGNHLFSIVTKDFSGNELTPGIYFVNISINENNYVEKIIIY
jgi:hypothetical protein